MLSVYEPKIRLVLQLLQPKPSVLFIMSPLTQGLTLLVKISPNMKRKVVLPQVPESVEDLKNILRENLVLQGNFTLQYEDPDFNNELCNLITMAELPHERVILHILWDEPLLLTFEESPSVDSMSSLDTASVSTSESPQSPSTFIRNYMRSVSE